MTKQDKDKIRLLVRVAHAVKKIRKTPEPYIPIEVRKAAAQFGIFITQRF